MWKTALYRKKIVVIYVENSILGIFRYKNDVDYSIINPSKRGLEYG